MTQTNETDAAAVGPEDTNDGDSGRETRAPASADGEAAAPSDTGAAPEAAAGAGPGVAGRPESLRAFGWRDWFAVLKGVFREMGDNELTLIAAGVAFYAFLAIFPMIAALVALYGLLLDPQSLERQLDGLEEIAPPGGFAILESQMRGLAEAGRTQLGYASILSLVLTLWTARAGVGALIRGLNIVFKVGDKRSFLISMVVPYAMTILLLVVTVLALAAVVILPGALATFNALSPVPLDWATEFLIRFARWPILLGMLIVTIGLLYRYGPAEPRPRFSWFSHGAIFALVLWIAGSALFSSYVRNFGTYNETYGSLGAIVGLLMWFYLSALIVLLGAEINAQIEFRLYGAPSERDPVHRKQWRKVTDLARRGAAAATAAKTASEATGG